MTPWRKNCFFTNSVGKTGYLQEKENYTVILHCLQKSVPILPDEKVLERDL